MALPPEISERLFILCDTIVECGQEGVESLIGDMSREELETVLVEAVRELVDASSRLDKEIERFQRRLAKRRDAPDG